MSPLTRVRAALPAVRPPAQPDVYMYTPELGEVTKATDAAHCHHSTHCLSPLRVGELVVPVDGGPFFALLDHVEKDARSVHVVQLNAGGVPKRL